MTEMVYFIEANGRIKIGVSGHVAARFLSIKGSARDTSAKLLAAFPGNRKTEAAIQRAFAFCRADGEWFNQSDQLMDFIASVGVPPDLEDIGVPLIDDAPCASHLIAELVNILKLHGDIPVFLQSHDRSISHGPVRIIPARCGDELVAVVEQVVEPVDE